MRFVEPQVLYVLLLLPAIAFFFFWATKRKREDMAKLGDPELLRGLSPPSPQGELILRYAVWMLALALIIFAAARPQWGAQVQTLEREGIQIMLVLDVSESMLADDLSPNRLTRAKIDIIELMSRLEGDEIGLVLFSGASFIQFPLTFDYSTAQGFLQRAGPEVISRPGTAIAEAIETAMVGLDLESDGRKAIILLTDGENQEGDPVAAARAAAQSGVTVFAVGYGFPQGQTIPIIDRFGQNIGFKTDANSQRVITSLDEPALQEIARAGGGRYLSASQSNVVELLQRNLEGLEKARLEQRTQNFRVERFQWFLGAALLALLFTEVVSDRIARGQSLGNSAGGALNE